MVLLKLFSFIDWIQNFEKQSYVDSSVTRWLYYEVHLHQ